MNTFNEFELNRMKKFYADELESRLQRSKSSRLAQSSSAAKLASTCQVKAGRAFGGGLAGPSFAPANGAESDGRGSPFIDLNRYQHAFLARQARGRSRRRSQVARFGRALFDFQAKGERELSLRRGDLLELLELPDPNWALVEDCQSGLQGLVPLNYVDHSVGCGVAKRDVSSQQRVVRAPPDSQAGTMLEEPLLAMSKGEPITLIRRLSGHWYEASNTRQSSGLVWSNDVDIIKQPVLAEQRTAAGQVNSSCHNLSDEFTDDDDDDEQDGGGNGDHYEIRPQRCRSSSNRRANTEQASLSGQRISARSAANIATCCSLANPECSGESGAKQMLAASSSGQPESAACCQRQSLQLGACNAHLPRRSSSSPYISSLAGQQVIFAELPRLCRARYPYKPRQEDELELVAGDILMVVHECDDGWFIGSSYANKRIGTFPGNFVEPI